MRPDKPRPHLNPTSREVGFWFMLQAEVRMALSVQEFLALSKEPSSIGDCGICREPIHDEHPDEVRRVNGKLVHEDCYYGALGDEIEKHPIASAGIRRG